VSYPEDTADKRLAGKTFVYTVKVNGIKQKSLPELNDEFAKELGEFDSLDAVRTQIRENMEAGKAPHGRACRERQTGGRTGKAQ